MNVIRRRGWEISDRLATPEHLAFSRRTLLSGAASALALAPCAANAQRLTDVAKLPDPSAELYPARRNEKYALDRPITDEKVNGNYNNFYEFGTSKNGHHCRAGADDPALDGEDRRHGGKADGSRHR